MTNNIVKKVKISMIVLNPLPHDTRVIREAQALSGVGYEVTVYALHEDWVDDHQVDYPFLVHHIKLLTKNWSSSSIGISLKFFEFFIRCQQMVRNDKSEICHCHELTALPIGYFVHLINGAKVIYDSHELETGRAGLDRTPKWYQWLYRFAEGHLIKRIDIVITVGESIADELVRQYGIDRPIVVCNIPISDGSTIKNRQTIRQLLNINSDKKIILYQGAVISGRGLMKLIESVKFIRSKVRLVILGDGDMKSDLIRFVKEMGLENDVTFLDYVSPDILHEYTGSADVGLAPIENVSLSYYFTLPNKLFEYITSELPIAASNFPDMAKLINHYDIGELFNPDDPKAIAGAVDKILEDPEYYDKLKANVKRARMDLTWDNEKLRLLEIYRNI